MPGSGKRLCAWSCSTQAQAELHRHVPDEPDPDWLTVFDQAALDGHRGSCLLDLGMPDRALAPLGDQDRAADGLFVRNRMIWQLDRIEALLHLGAIDQACQELLAALLPERGSITPRVAHRFRAVELRLRDLPPSGGVVDTLERVRPFSAAFA